MLVCNLKRLLCCFTCCSFAESTTFYLDPDSVYRRRRIKYLITAPGLDKQEYHIARSQYTIHLTYTDSFSIQFLFYISFLDFFNIHIHMTLWNHWNGLSASMLLCRDYWYLFI